MPTYQYACTECGHAFEQVQSFSDDALTVCPECQGRLRKLFNAVGVVFKGSGFYRNDSRGKDRPPRRPTSPADGRRRRPEPTPRHVRRRPRASLGLVVGSTPARRGSSSSTSTKSPQPTAS